MSPQYINKKDACILLENEKKNMNSTIRQFDIHCDSFDILFIWLIEMEGSLVETA